MGCSNGFVASSPQTSEEPPSQSGPVDTAINAQLTVTRISGPAPLAVLFNASSSSHSTNGSLDSFKDFTYSFDAGDNNTSTYATTNGLKRRHSGGPLFAYVYETPRSNPYVAKVRDQDAAGNWNEAQIEITVQDPNTVFSGTQTICVGTPLPTAGSGGCPSGAQVSTSLPASSAYSGKRVLLKRNGSYGSLSLNSNTNDTQVGAYGTGSAPQLSELSVGAGPSGTAGDHPSRVVVQDLSISGNLNGPISGDDILFLRNTMTGDGNTNVDLAATANGYWRDNPPGGWNSTHFPEPRRIFYFENSMNAAGTYGALIDGALVGNTFNALPPSQHSLRIWYAIRSVFAHNVMGRVGDSIRHSFKLHSSGVEDCGSQNVNSITSTQCSTQKVIISNNIFGHVSNSNDWTVALRPENTTSNQGLEDIITENNTFVRGSNTSVDLLVVGRRLSSRNNRLSNSSAIISSSGGTSTNSCTGYTLNNSWCGPYFLNLEAITPNWP